MVICPPVFSPVLEKCNKKIRLSVSCVGCRLNPCTSWNAWPPDNWCSRLSTGCCCSIDQSSLSAVISMAVPNLWVSWKDLLKHQVNWNTVCGAIHDLPWRNIWVADNPVEVLNEHLSLLVGCDVPTKVSRVRNMDKPWFDQYRHAFLIKDWGLISVGLSEHLYAPEIASRLNQPGVCLNSQVMTMDIGSETA